MLDMSNDDLWSAEEIDMPPKITDARLKLRPLLASLLPLPTQN